MEAVDVLAFSALAIDDTSYADVFNAHHRGALRLAYLLTSDEDAAQDVVATAFTKVYPHWRKGRVDNIGAYLRRAVANEAKTDLRRRYRSREQAQRLDGDDRGALAATDRVGERDAMWEAICALPERMRQCVVLRYYEDLSENETADILGISAGTVKSSLSRGLDKLEELLLASGSALGGGH